MVYGKIEKGGVNLNKILASLVAISGSLVLMYTPNQHVVTNKQVVNKVVTKKVIYYALASWYAKGKCKDGTPFTGRHWTVASNKLPRGTKIKITYRGKSCISKVTDYGPDTTIFPERLFDCSLRVANYLGFTTNGIALIRVEIVDKNAKLGPC